MFKNLRIPANVGVKEVLDSYWLVRLHCLILTSLAETNTALQDQMFITIFKKTGKKKVHLCF